MTYHAGGRGLAVVAHGAQLAACRSAPQSQAAFRCRTNTCLAHLDAHYRGMPPVAAMEVAIVGYDGRALRLRAPLSRNINDKGCAFGGSLASLMTLAAWGVVSLHIQGAGMEAEVYVADSQVRYLAPLWADLDAEARAAPDVDWHAFLATLAERGRARTELRGPRRASRRRRSRRPSPPASSPSGKARMRRVEDGETRHAEDDPAVHVDGAVPVRARARRLRDLGRRRQPVDRKQYAYSAAIRWGDFEGAWTLVDPEYRKAHPLSDVELERYKQVQIAGYRDLATQTLPDGDVGARNRDRRGQSPHPRERQTRYTERWHFDPVAKQWWLIVGLPDLWAGH